MRTNEEMEALIETVSMAEVHSLRAEVERLTHERDDALNTLTRVAQKAREVFAERLTAQVVANRTTALRLLARDGLSEGTRSNLEIGVQAYEEFLRVIQTVAMGLG